MIRKIRYVSTFSLNVTVDPMQHIEWPISAPSSGADAIANNDAWQLPWLSLNVANSQSYPCTTTPSYTRKVVNSFISLKIFSQSHFANCEQVSIVRLSQKKLQEPSRVGQTYCTTLLYAQVMRLCHPFNTLLFRLPSILYLSINKHNPSRNASFCSCFSWI